MKHRQRQSSNSRKSSFLSRSLPYGCVAIFALVVSYFNDRMLVSLHGESGPIASATTTATTRVVVSLTTIPERLPYIQPILDSLVGDHQSLKPDVVYLTLPRQRYKYYSSSHDTNSTHKTQNQTLYKLWPDFLKEYLETTQLEILQPAWDYGPITKVLYALEQENVKLRSTIYTTDTRIVYLDDDVVYDPDLVKRLVEASQSYPDDSVVAMSGANWRSHFRQIRHTHSKYDKFPNVFVHVSGDSTFSSSSEATAAALPVDFVQGFTGVCLSSNTIRNMMTFIGSSMDDKEQWQQQQPLLYKILQDPSLPSAVVKSDDILLSAMMEVLNVTRWVVPGGTGTKIQFTKSAKLKALSSGMHHNLMGAAFYLQRRLNIWNEYQFLDPSHLTREQLEAIDCEASYAQDCSGTMCWPSAKHCPKAKVILHGLSTMP